MFFKSIHDKFHVSQVAVQ